MILELPAKRKKSMLNKAAIGIACGYFDRIVNIPTKPTIAVQTATAILSNRKNSLHKSDFFLAIIQLLVIKNMYDTTKILGMMIVRIETSLTKKIGTLI